MPSSASQWTPPYAATNNAWFWIEETALCTKFQPSCGLKKIWKCLKYSYGESSHLKVHEWITPLCWGRVSLGEPLMTTLSLGSYRPWGICRRMQAESRAHRMLEKLLKISVQRTTLDCRCCLQSQIAPGPGSRPHPDLEGSEFFQNFCISNVFLLFPFISNLSVPFYLVNSW